MQDSADLKGQMKHKLGAVHHILLYNLNMVYEPGEEHLKIPRDKSF